MANPTDFIKFARDVKLEAGRITWPKLKDTRQMTIMVFILASLIALFLLGVDALISSGLNLLFGW